MGRGRKPELTDWFQSDECNKIIELSKQGYSVGRIAELTGVNKSRINYARRIKGFKSERAFKTDGIVYKEKWFALHKQALACQDRNLKTKLRKESNLAYDLDRIGFDYIGGYSGLNSHIKVRCRVCNGTFTRYCDRDFRDRVQWNQIECPCCIEKARILREEEARRREEQRLFYLEQKRKRKEEKRLKRLNGKHICKECGKEFTLKEFGEREHVDVTNYGDVLYCSFACRRVVDNRRARKYNTTRGNHKLRSIKYGTDFDKSVNLDDLIKRNGLRCALCGEMCDTNDKQTINGIVICGNNYPSIDHIKPMSKGGSHTWDNVQVAHRICNTLKGTSVVA